MTYNDIINGDSKDILAQFGNELFDLVVTDPPYLVNYKDRDGRRVANDDNAAGVLPVFDEIYRTLKNNSYCISFYGWTHIHAFTRKWHELGFKTIGHIVWAKDYTSRVGVTEYRHENAFILAKGNPKRPSNPIPDVQPWHYTGNKSHPTEKAVEVIAPLIKSFSSEGDIVLDPFSGSGSTAVAAALNDRQYVGIELDQSYCEFTRKRLEGVKRKQAWQSIPQYTLCSEFDEFLHM